MESKKEILCRVITNHLVSGTKVYPSRSHICFKSSYFSYNIGFYYESYFCVGDDSNKRNMFREIKSYLEDHYGCSIEEVLYIWCSYQNIIRGKIEELKK